jgi:hypothetical protein
LLLARSPGHSYDFGYDEFDRLIKGEDPTGGVMALLRTDQDRCFIVAVSTVMGRTTNSLVDNLTTGDRPPGWPAGNGGHQ